MRRLFVPAFVSLLFASNSAAPADSTGAMTAEAATALAREVSAKVEQLRGARFVRPVQVRLVDDATARAHFRTRILKFYPQEKIQNDQRAYENLGLLPAGTDLLKLLLDILEEQAGAYYDPETDTFFVLKDMPRSTAPILMAHELTHALDDQRFNIDAMLNKLNGDDDRTTAYTAVVEGSGTTVMSLFLLQERQTGHLDPQAITDLMKSEAGQAKRLMAAPPLLQRSMVAPYQLGQAFLLHGNPTQFSSFSASETDRAFQNPPASTEQIIHCEKYWDPTKRDVPAVVRVADLSPLLGPGWKLTTSGTLGEMVVALLTGLGPIDLGSLSSAQPASWTNRAATGWGGDRYQHYVNASRALTVFAAVWDSEEDAAEFVTALSPMPGRNAYRHGDTTVVLAGDRALPSDTLAEKVFTAISTSRVAPAKPQR
jgi:hypothetical protein